MFEGFYGLSGPPFKLNPDPRFFFGSESHRKAMSYLKFGLHQEEGFIVITGAVGSGKSTVVNQLFAELDSEKIIAAKIVTTQLDAMDILRMLCGELGIEPAAPDKASILQALTRFLAYQSEAARRVLLIIDEAQNLPRDTLEELRMLSNLTHNGKALFQSFLVGQPQFSRTLADPELEQFLQRVIASYNLETLSAEETKSYIEHRLRLVGWQGNPTFTHGAYRMIHAETKGLPRRINLLCNRILFFGAIEGLQHVDDAVVTEVLSDLRNEAVETASAAARTPVATNGAGPAAVNGSGHDVVAVQALDTRLATIEGDLGEYNAALRDILELVLQHIETHRRAP
jgi:general secretion pathway protein A